MAKWSRVRASSVIVLGNPSSIVWRLINWFSDELIYLDISRSGSSSQKRSDLNYQHKSDILEMLEEVSGKCFMPMTVGGGVKSIEDIRDRLARGADKVAINTQALLTPELIQEAAKCSGSQCIVISIGL